MSAHKPFSVIAVAQVAAGGLHFFKHDRVKLGAPLPDKTDRRARWRQCDRIKVESPDHAAQGQRRAGGKGVSAQQARFLSGRGHDIEVALIRARLSQTARQLQHQRHAARVVERPVAYPVDRALRTAQPKMVPMRKEQDRLFVRFRARKTPNHVVTCEIAALRDRFDVDAGRQLDGSEISALSRRDQLGPALRAKGAHHRFLRGQSAEGFINLTGQRRAHFARIGPHLINQLLIAPAGQLRHNDHRARLFAFKQDAAFRVEAFSSQHDHHFTAHIFRHDLRRAITGKDERRFGDHFALASGDRNRITVCKNKTALARDDFNPARRGAKIGEFHRSAPRVSRIVGARCQADFGETLRDIIDCAQSARRARLTPFEGVAGQRFDVDHHALRDPLALIRQRAGKRSGRARAQPCARRQNEERACFHPAVQPPSMLQLAPVTFAASSRHKNTAIAPTSST